MTNGSSVSPRRQRTNLVSEAPIEDTPAGEPRIDPAILDQAVTWFATLASGQATASQEAAFIRWRATHPDHDRAWQRLSGVQQALIRGAGATGSDVARQVVLSAGSRRAARRRALKILGGMAVLGGSGLVASRQPQWQGLMAQYRTGTGERRELVLPDGTRLFLNTATALSIALEGQRRIIELHDGEVRVTTASDPQRHSLSVVTADGHAQPVGTKFTVRRYHDDQGTQVRVIAGMVMLQPSATEVAARAVPAGRQAVFTRNAVGRSEALDVAALTWVDGMLSAERMPLSDFLDTLARHRAGRLRYDPAVADLRITGAFPLDDTDRVLDAVARTLPVEVHRRTRYWVSVSLH